MLERIVDQAVERPHLVDGYRCVSSSPCSPAAGDRSLAAQRGSGGSGEAGSSISMASSGTRTELWLRHNSARNLSHSADAAQARTSPSASSAVSATKCAELHVICETSETAAMHTVPQRELRAVQQTLP